MATKSESYLSRLHRLIDARFDLEDLRTLAFELSVKFDSLPGEGSSTKARELILFMARHERLAELVAALRKARPVSDWPDVPRDLALPTAADTPKTHSQVGDTNQTGNIINSNVAMGRGAQVISYAPRYDLSGNFRGAIVNIEPTLRDTRQAIETLLVADDAARAGLIRLVGQLDKALQAAPPGREEAAAEVADMTQALVDAAGAEKPKKPAIRALGEGLKEAAEALRDDLPAVVEIAARIAATVATLPSAK